MTKRTRTQKTSITERSDHDQKNKNRQKTQTIEQHQKWRVDLIRSSSSTSVTRHDTNLKDPVIHRSQIRLCLCYAYVMSIQHCHPMKCLTWKGRMFLSSAETSTSNNVSINALIKYLYLK